MFGLYAVITYSQKEDRAFKNNMRHFLIVAFFFFFANGIGYSKDIQNFSTEFPSLLFFFIEIIKSQLFILQHSLPH